VFYHRLAKSTGAEIHGAADFAAGGSLSGEFYSINGQATPNFEKGVVLDSKTVDCRKSCVAVPTEREQTGRRVCADE
jgi:hypothetical protein